MHRSPKTGSGSRRDERQPLTDVRGAVESRDVELCARSSDRSEGGACDAPTGACDAQHALGTIGSFGSLALIINNISGPGMLDFPAAFQNAGWARTCVVDDAY